MNKDLFKYIYLMALSNCFLHSSDIYKIEKFFINNKIKYNGFEKFQKSWKRAWDIE